MTKQQQKAIPITAFVYILTETMYMLLNITEIEKRLVSKVMYLLKSLYLLIAAQVFPVTTNKEQKTISV